MLVMGIVNVTPDSFSDGGKYYEPGQAIARARNMLAEGADFIDVGGESTRPGAEPVPWEEEWRRIEPVVRALADGGARVSVDTYHFETARRALDAGADMVNCVMPGCAEELLGLCAERKRRIIVPLQSADVAARAQFAACEEIFLDPLVGFGTTREEDLAILHRLPELAKTAKLAVGASRKRIVRRLTGEKTVGKTLGGNISIAVWCALAGVALVRVHDVRETVQAVKTFDAIARGGLDAANLEENACA